MALHHLAVLEELTRTIEARKAVHDDEHSYVASLMKGGEDAILKKVIEEAGEVLMAAKDQDPAHLARETADLLFHTMVLLSYHNLNLDAVLQQLASRQSQSGLAEKASRNK